MHALTITRTAPYFHHGSEAKIHEAVRVMALTQPGRSLNPAAMAAFVVPLQALNDAMPANDAPPRQQHR